MRSSAFVTLGGEADVLAGELGELLAALPAGETGETTDAWRTRET